MCACLFVCLCMNVWRVCVCERNEVKISIQMSLEMDFWFSVT